MTLEQRTKFAAHLQRLLKVRTISFPIGNTEKGPLSIKYTKDQDGYEIILDAVPLNQKDYDNRELKSIIEKYLFEKEVLTNVAFADNRVFAATQSGEMLELVEEAPKKKPKPSKKARR